MKKSGLNTPFDVFKGDRIEKKITQNKQCTCWGASLSGRRFEVFFDGFFFDLGCLAFLERLEAASTE